jgi:phage terminase large subunit-like protein
LIDAFAEKCSFNRLAVKVRKLARRYGAWFVIIENTARGSDLIEEMNLKLPGVAITSVNPKGKKSERLLAALPIIRRKRIRIRRLSQVEMAIDEVIAFPNAP